MGLTDRADTRGCSDSGTPLEGSIVCLLALSALQVKSGLDLPQFGFKF